MAQIRRELHEDVKGVVEGAEAATDWRRYVRSYPWATAGLALAIGYFVVPRRHRPTTIQIAPPQAVTQTVKSAVKGETPHAIKVEKERKSLLMMGLGMVAPVALRAAQGYALKYAEQWLTQKLAESPMGSLHDLASSFAGQQAPPPQPPPSPQPQRGPGSTPGGPRF